MNDDIVNQLLDLRAEGLNNAEIGRRVDMNRREVSRILVEAGYPADKRHLPPAKELVDMLTQYTPTELGQLLECKPGTIQAKITRARQSGELPAAPAPPPPAAPMTPPRPPVRDPDWNDRALCRFVPDLFYAPDKDPVNGGSAEEVARVREARAVCAQCPVILECRVECDRYEEGVDSRNMLHGIWAGETPRARIKRRGHLADRHAA